MKVLVDGDIVAFRASASAWNDPDWVARSRCDNTIEQLTETISRLYHIDSVHIYISGEGNFRRVLAPDYKKNREGKARPPHLEPLRERLMLRWNAEITHGYEADDAIGMNLTEDSIVCSIDKDLKQLPGLHYNWPKDQWETIDDATAIFNFYRATLTGDAVDHVKGCPGIGKVKSKYLLENCGGDYFGATREAFNNDALLLQQGRLIWVIRPDRMLWSPPQLCGPGRAAPYAFLTKAGEIKECWEHISETECGTCAHGTPSPSSTETAQDSSPLT